MMPDTYDYTKLFGLWKGSKLDLEALVSERMKPYIIRNCPNMQIGGIKNNSSTEHLIIVKTWMKNGQIL